MWHREHMDKIVPSVLYNLHDPDVVDSADGASSQPDSPKQLADTCLRELLNKAAYGTVRNVLAPVLRHCDAHQLWTMQSGEGAQEIFTIVM